MDEEPVINPDDNPFTSPAMDGAGQAEDGLKVKYSGWILAVAVMNFLYILPLLFLSVYLILTVGMHLLDNPARFTQIWVELVTYIFSIALPAGSLLLTGLGLIYRKQWGRILAFVMGALMALAGLFYCTCIVVLMMETRGGITNFGPESNAIFGLIILSLFALLYPIITYGILRQKKYAAEFTKNIATKSEQPA